MVLNLVHGGGRKEIRRVMSSEMRDDRCVDQLT